MSEDQFIKLFKYVEEFRKEVNYKLDQKAEQSSLESLQRTIDRFINRLDDQEIGEALLQNRLDELVSWAKKVSKKTGIPLKDL